MDRTTQTIVYLIAMHVLGLLAMSACRLVLLFSNIPADGIDWSLTGDAMLIGLKFDNLIGCYIAALPCLVLPILSLIMESRPSYVRIMRRAIHISDLYFGILYSIVIFIGVADARYFHFFANHLNIGVTEWFGYIGDTTGMIFGDSMNWLYLGIAALLIGIYLRALHQISKHYK